ncbi:Gfo/Idh/MocA family protein [Paenibacillus lutrae]|uniref:Gfo/Idh/MocA family oxidoreductase n=1 Tax=Paenibacillus lutrae TaxID=2078573 RepID=A0A7X3JYA3_9BACL|nr:Gfo/Idh/MocA family oxidoreductase [Paenibacillus lutrae]MVO98913.1 gfo/Idh/MocA family oxidoreductase [Paenibacillus lutrae]
MNKVLRIGMIGLDTSHAVEFTKLLNDPANPYHVPGGKVVIAYPGGSDDFELSRSRVEGFTNKLRDDFGVEIVDSPAAVAAACDAILLESADGRVHAEQFRQIAPFGKPVFIDKPLAVSSKEAADIAALAKSGGIPLMSSSSLRFAEEVTRALADTSKGALLGADCYGPMALEPTQPGLFWYGIHMVEMLYAALGPGCVRVTAFTQDAHDVVVGVWADGRIGTVRGNRAGSFGFGAQIHREKGTIAVDVAASAKPFYASLLERVMEMFAGGPAVRLEETLEVIRFIEAANESRETGLPVRL